ncbi:MAG: hypothetical protein CMF26_07245 [Kiloniella sp.]|nr:hypothetical protein [Kiloniella sp.]
MLRLSIFIAALIGVFIAALSLTPRLLTPADYRAPALMGLSSALGQPVEAGQDAAIRLLPRPRLQLTDIRVLGDGERTGDILLAADTATFDLRASALVTGKLVVEAVELDRPVIFLTRAEDGSVTFGAAPLFSGLSGRRDAPASLSLLSLSRGELLYTDVPLGQSLRLGIDTLQVEQVEGYAFQARGKVTAGQAPFDIDVAFVPVASERGERGFDIDVQGRDGRSFALSGEIDDKFSSSLIVREDLGWKLRADGFRHPLLARIGLDEGQGVRVESRVLSDQEGYDFPGLTLSLPEGQQMRGKARLSPSRGQSFLDLVLSGSGIALSTAASDLSVRDWTALLPGAAADLGGLGLRFDIGMQDMRLPNGTQVERLTATGALTADEGLRVTALRVKTEDAVSFDLDHLQVAGPDELVFRGRVTADSPARLIAEPERAQLAASLGRLSFQGEVALVDGALAVTEGRVETSQGGFSVDGAPFLLDAVSGLGAARLSVDVETLDLGSWAPDLDVSALPTLAEQGRVLTERMRALGAGTLSIRAGTATLGPRSFRDFEAEVETLGDRSQVLDVGFLDEDGNYVHAITRFDNSGAVLQSGQIDITLSDRPRSAERALERFAGPALSNELLARAVDVLPLERLRLLRPTADRPWELSLISPDTDLSATLPDAEGNQTWSFTSVGAADLLAILGLPETLLRDASAGRTAEDAGGTMISGRFSTDELVGIGTVLGANLSLTQLPPDGDAPHASARRLQLTVDHPEGSEFLGRVGLADLQVPVGEGLQLDLRFDVPMAADTVAATSFELELKLGDDNAAQGRGSYHADTRSLSFVGQVEQIAAAHWLAALSSGAEANRLWPLLVGLSGDVGLGIAALDAGGLGQVADADLAVSFTPGRFVVDRLSGQITDGPWRDGQLDLSGEVLVGQDVFTDLAISVTDARPVFQPALNTALAFEAISFLAESFQARAPDFAGLLQAGSASFEVQGVARLELALTAINAAEELLTGPWERFLTGPQGIAAYEDLRTLFFDGKAALTGLVHLDQGVMTTSTLTLAGRRGTLLAKAGLALTGQSPADWAAIALDGDGPTRIELYSADDTELVEQVLLISGPVANPAQLAIER